MIEMQLNFLLGLILLQFVGQNYSKTYLIKTRDPVDTKSMEDDHKHGYGDGHGDGHKDRRPIAKNYMCNRDLSDRLPENLISVLEDPVAYIAGPLGRQVVPKEEALIIGAGMAGLTAAYLLLSVGHKVTLLEGQNRIGGRVYTHYGKGWYGELGAMRFKECHKILMKAFEIFDVPLAPFTSKDQGSQGNYYVLNGKTVPTEKMFSQEGLPYIYKTFGIPDSKIPKYRNGSIMNPRKIIEKYLKRELYDRDHCKQDESFASFIRRKLAGDKYDERIADIFATLTVMQSFMTYTADYFLSDADSDDLDNRCTSQNMVEIVNGSSVMPENMRKKLEAFPDFKLITGAKVTKVEDQSNSVLIHYKHGHTEKTLYGDWVLVTATAGAVDLMKFDPPLPFWKKLALRNLKYTNAAKVFLKFKTPFWSKSENNLASPIKYGPLGATKNMSWADFDQFKDQKMGATGITDHHLKQIYYPSFDFHGPALLASYTWDSDADVFLSLQDEDVQELTLSELEGIHGPVVREEFESMVVKRWQADEFSHGAYVFHEPFQKYTYMNHLRDPVGNIHFAGEYTNKQYNGWVESALESSLRAMVNRAPKKYDEKFREDELKKLREEGYKL